MPHRKPIWKFDYYVTRSPTASILFGSYTCPNPENSMTHFTELALEASMASSLSDSYSCHPKFRSFQSLGQVEAKIGPGKWFPCHIFTWAPLSQNFEITRKDHISVPHLGVQLATGQIHLQTKWETFFIAQNYYFNPVKQRFLCILGVKISSSTRARPCWTILRGSTSSGAYSCSALERPTLHATWAYGP